MHRPPPPLPVSLSSPQAPLPAQSRAESAPLELSAVVLDTQYIEVITCGRVGRLENPFHFVPSEPPRPGAAARKEKDGRGHTPGDGAP